MRGEGYKSHKKEMMKKKKKIKNGTQQTQSWGKMGKLFSQNQERKKNTKLNGGNCTNKQINIQIKPG